MVFANHRIDFNMSGILIEFSFSRPMLNANPVWDKRALWLPGLIATVFPPMRSLKVTFPARLRVRTEGRWLGFC